MLVKLPNVWYCSDKLTTKHAEIYAKNTKEMPFKMKGIFYI
ncbi:MAG: hypothetical protein K0S33_2827 [Bacteroidetes bacterium]|jgi:hypothetical protein|nr:hypothetical protein [Bacteroidota bacterium]